MLTAATLRHQEAARVWALRDQIIDARYELSLTHCVKQEAQDKQDAESRDLHDQIAMLERLAQHVEDGTREISNVWDCVLWAMSTRQTETNAPYFFMPTLSAIPAQA